MPGLKIGHCASVRIVHAISQRKTLAALKRNMDGLYDCIMRVLHHSLAFYFLNSNIYQAHSHFENILLICNSKSRTIFLVCWKNKHGGMSWQGTCLGLSCHAEAASLFPGSATSLNILQAVYLYRNFFFKCSASSTLKKILVFDCQAF